MNSACEIMRDALVHNLIPDIERRAVVSLDSGDIPHHNYLNRCASILKEAVDIGERNDVNESKYWEGFRQLALTTIQTNEIRLSTK